MDNSQLDSLIVFLQTRGVDIGLKIVGAFAIWTVGRWIIRTVVRFVIAGLERRHTEPTLVRYAQSTLSTTLSIALVIGLLGFCGVETTSFAALIAAVGVAIGMAWSGLLANFAAGIFLLLLKPFKVGDTVMAGGVVGTVMEIGLFATTMLTDDGVVTFVGNNKVFGDNIKNMSASHQRRVDLVAQLAHGVDVEDARQRLRARIAEIPHVLPTPAPSVEILEFNASGTLLAVRPFVANTHYWDVYFATNEAIRQTFGSAGYPAPYTLQGTAAAPSPPARPAGARVPAPTS
jgi:small conductance mechanosensitive channel